jgi:ribose transport system ATP-binding protein
MPLETAGIRKEYPGTVALKGVSLRFEEGKIHALVGKNGAGKSTLVKIFAGALQPTAGSILLNGTPIQLRSPREALEKGIAAVHQELSLVPELSVAENIFLGRLPVKTGFGQGMFVDWREVERRAEETLAGFELHLDVRAKAGRLGVAQQQMVEIAKAMSYNPAVLMLDEPTSALARRETEHLFELLHRLASRGIILLSITHRLQELQGIADEISVLRNGEVAGTIGIQEASPATLAGLMFGQTIPTERPADLPVQAAAALEIRNLTRTGAFQEVSFTLHRGEILGIAGLLGAGRTELLRSIFGVDPADSGEVVVDGMVLRPSSPSQMKRLGIALTPENRKAEGLIQNASTRFNMCIASLDRLTTGGFITRERERTVVRSMVKNLDMLVGDMEAPVSMLSGGNQQKVVAGKWLNTAPRVILFDEPTRGIDVQAKQQMFQIIYDLSRKGISSLVVSSELEELLDICHRILVMRSGRIVATLDPRRTTIEQLVVTCMEDGTRS